MPTPFFRLPIRCVSLAVTVVVLLPFSLLPHRIHAEKPHAAMPILIDTDAGDDIDDAYALALLLRSPEVSIQGVTTTFGDTQLRAHLVMRLLAGAGRPDIPVAAGPSTALPKAARFTQKPFAEADTHTLRNENGPDMILRLARRHPGQITLLALGPLQTIEAALDRDPAGFRKLRQVVLMGGSVVRGYNKGADIHTPPSVEWNVMNDPAGLRKLLSSGVPVTVLPLDSTQVALPADIQHDIESRGGPLGADLGELQRERGYKVVLFDALTASCLVDPSICPTVPMHLTIEDPGYTRDTPGTPNAKVCLTSDSERFLHLLASRLVR